MRYTIPMGLFPEMFREADGPSRTAGEGAAGGTRPRLVTGSRRRFADLPPRTSPQRALGDYPC